MDEYRVRETGEVYDFFGLLAALPMYSIPNDPPDYRLDEIGVDRVRFYQPSKTKYQNYVRNGIEWIKTADAVPEVPEVPPNPEIEGDEGTPAIPAVPEQGYWRTVFDVVDMSTEEHATTKEYYQSLVWSEIREERDRRLAAKGVPVMVNGVQKGFETDAMNRTRYLRMSGKAFRNIAGGAPGTGPVATSDGVQIEWKTMDNTVVPMTNDLAIAIGDALELQESKVFRNAEVHKATMLMLDDPEGYDYSTGWPDQYIVPDLYPDEF